jgi:NADH:ubiquinone oxidoreductase subunit 6 (subunit J)
VGALAIYYLLPRPRAYPVFWGIAAGVLALLWTGVWLIQSGVVWQETVLFYAFSAIAVVAGALLVTQQNPARAALSFTLVVLATCGLFLLLAAPFLMAATIVVYAGAIVVTFLFVLMLAQQEGLSDADARSREPLLATLTGFVLLGALLYVIKTSSEPRAAQINAVLAAVDPFKQAVDVLDSAGFNELRGRAEELGVKASENDEKKREEALTALKAVLFEARERLTLASPERAPLSDLSGPSASTPRGDIRRDPRTGVPELPAENAAYLGKSLFTDYLLPVELGGFLLLVATVGAVAIGQRRPRPEPAEDRRIA